MKNFKALLLLIAMLSMSFTAKADHDQVITYNQLPQAAQELLKANFADKVPLIITMDWDDFTIRYESGEKVEFNKKGEWKEIECYGSTVPANLIPEQIKKSVQAQFPGTSILKIERNRRGYEVKLNNGREVEYDLNFNVLDIDYDD